MYLENWDLVIIGAGAAGLAAGVYGGRSGLSTIIIEEKLAGGTTADAPLVENYLGFQSVSGIELSQKMVEHARSSGVTINEFEGAHSLRIETEKKTIQTQKETYTCRALIIASGSHYRPLDVPGEKEFR
jgi:thioredoxin reductase (NADPH)